MLAAMGFIYRLKTGKIVKEDQGSFFGRRQSCFFSTF